jgi:hypothetical protein
LKAEHDGVIGVYEDRTVREKLGPLKADICAYEG